MERQPRADAIPAQIGALRLMRRLESAPWGQIDHVRQRLEPPAASQVIVAGEPLGSVRIIPEHHSLPAVAWQDHPLAGLARWATRPAAVRKLVIKEHAILQTCHKPPVPAARLPQADVRLATRPLQRCVTPLVPAHLSLTGARMAKHIKHLEADQPHRRRCPGTVVGGRKRKRASAPLRAGRDIVQRGVICGRENHAWSMMPIHPGATIRRNTQFLTSSCG